MVYNLVDRKDTPSGKALNFSMFGFKDNALTKDIAILKQFGVETANVKKSVNELNLDISGLTDSSRKLANELINSGKTGSVASEGFLDIADSLEKTAGKSKLAALGMKAVSMAYNFGIILAFSLALKGICSIFDTLSVSLEEQQEKVSALNDKYITINKEIKELSDKKLTSPLDIKEKTLSLSN